MMTTSYSSMDSIFGNFGESPTGYWRFGKAPAVFLFTWYINGQFYSNLTTTITWKITVDDIEINDANITLDSMEFGIWPIGQDYNTYPGGTGAQLSKTVITTSKQLKYNDVIASGSFTVSHTNITSHSAFTARVHNLVCSNGLNVGTIGQGTEGKDDTRQRLFYPSAHYSSPSTVVIEPGTIGQKTNLRIFKHPNAEAASYYTIYFKVGDLYESIVSELTNITYDWTIPKEVYRYFQDKIGWGSITVTEHYVDGGFDNYYFKFCFKINPADCAATFNYTITDTNPTTVALTGNSSKIVKYYSDIKWTVAATGAYDIPIWLVGAATEDQIIYGNLSLASASGTFDYPTSKEIRFYANDYRDMDTWITVNVPWVEYVALTNTTETKNPTPEGTVDINIKGNYFNGSFGAQNNSLTVQYRYKKLSADNFSNWITVTPSISNNTYTATTVLRGMDYTEAYQLETQVVDKLTTVSSGVKTIKAKTVFDWSKEDFNFNVPVSINGDTTLNGEVEINGDVSVVGNVSAGNIPAKLYSGTWTPTCNACSSPDTAYGTYMRIDDVCVINFYIGGTFTSTQTYLSFGGLPFTPSDEIRWQSGGGNLSGGTLQANSPFVCWNIESTDTDTIKKIYGRTCNVTINTSAGTRTSGYAGSKKSDTFHASGTICYKIAEGV